MRSHRQQIIAATAAAIFSPNKDPEQVRADAARILPGVLAALEAITPKEQAA